MQNMLFTGKNLSGINCNGAYCYFVDSSVLGYRYNPLTGASTTVDLTQTTSSTWLANATMIPDVVPIFGVDAFDGMVFWTVQNTVNNGARLIMTDTNLAFQHAWKLVNVLGDSNWVRYSYEVRGSPVYFYNAEPRVVVAADATSLNAISGQYKRDSGVYMVPLVSLADSYDNVNLVSLWYGPDGSLTGLEGISNPVVLNIGGYREIGRAHV